MTEKTGGPAFPVQEGSKLWTGVTLRDYFAAKAMLGILTETSRRNREIDPDEYRLLARHAYLVADAMIEMRGSYG